MSRLKGRPFEILAISLDDDREDLVEAVRQRKVPGIHTWDTAGWANPIGKLYNVQGIPAWYLIDPQGVISSRDPFADELLPAISAALNPNKPPAPKDRKK